jgi:hypothetical protein
MKKLLFCGNINSQWETVRERVDKLQASAHGPFDGLICIGSFFKDEHEFYDIGATLSFPIPTYVVDRTGFSNDYNPPRNVHFLASAGLETVLGGVTICSLARNAAELATAEYKDLIGRFERSEYAGCDILVTQDWPADVLQLLPES